MTPLLDSRETITDPSLPPTDSWLQQFEALQMKTEDLVKLEKVFSKIDESHGSFVHTPGSNAPHLKEVV